MKITTHQETDLWEFNLAVTKRQTQKVIFQPRILCWYSDREFRREPLPAPYTGMSASQLYKALGVSNRVYDYCACFQTECDGLTHETRQLDPMRYMDITHTPKGDLTAIWRKNTSNPGTYFEKWPVCSEDDLAIHQWIMENSRWKFNMDVYNSIKEEWGFAGAPQAYFDRVNVQNLMHNTMGIEGGLFALYDYPETIDKYFAAMHEFQDRMIDCFIDSPLEIANFGDNIHCGMLPPNLFEKYVLPEYQYRTDKFRSAGIFTNAHWDGDVKTLLPYVQATGLDGIEAVTPKPQGDVTLKEVRQAFGDKVFLMDGVAALLFDPNLYPIKDLENQTRECLDLFGGHLILGISDEMASTGTLDRIIRVRDIVDEYNAQIIE